MTSIIRNLMIVITLEHIMQNDNKYSDWNFWPEKALAEK